MSRLDYKLAVVTGAAQGFGAAAAAVLAREGANVLLTDTEDEAGQACAEALRAAGLKAQYQHLDTRDEMGWAVLTDQIMRSHGHLDILVNQAGASPAVTIELATPAQLREVLEADLIGPFLGMKTAIAALRQSGGGAVINIAANEVAELLPPYALYAAAKSALLGLTRNAAVHCFQRGYDIRVNALHPGTHETPLLEANALYHANSRRLETLLTTQTAGRDAPLQDFETAIAWLAGDESRHITGAEIFCTGPLTPAALDFSVARD